MDAELAVALVYYQLANSRPAAEQLIGAFLSVDRKGDVVRAVQALEAAARGGRPTDVLPPLPDSPQLAEDSVVPVAPAQVGGDIVQVALAKHLRPAPVPRVEPPAEAALEAATEQVRTLYAEDYKSRTESQRTALAEKLLRSGLETVNAPVARLALFREAARVAAHAGQPRMCRQAIEHAVTEYRLDRAAEYVPRQHELFSHARQSADLRAVLVESMWVVDDAIADGDFDGAQQILSGAMASLRRTNETELIRFCRGRREETEQLGKAHAALVAAWSTQADMDLTKQGPLLGRYLCLVRGDFERGLPLLRAGEVPPWSDLAKRESQAGGTTAEQLVVADAWWEAAATAPAASQRLVRAHATDLYDQIKRTLRGIDRKRVDARLDEFAGAYDPPSVASQTDLVAILTGGVGTIRWSSGTVWYDVRFEKSGEWTAASSSGTAYGSRWVRQANVVVVNTTDRRDVYQLDEGGIRVRRFDARGKLLQVGAYSHAP